MSMDGNPTSAELRGACGGELFYLIVTHNSNAVQQLKKEIGSSKQTPFVSFLCYRSPDVSKSCDCWFLLEYLDFFRGATICNNQLQTVLQSIEHGRCSHVPESLPDNAPLVDDLYHASVTLLHIAAAAGNKNVVKFLTKLNKQQIYSTTQPGLTPLHLAIIKNQSHLIDHLYDKNEVTQTANSFLVNSMDIVQRNWRTGELRRCYRKHESLPNIMCLVQQYNVNDKATIDKVIPLCFLLAGWDINGMFKHLLSSGSKDMASMIAKSAGELHTLDLSVILVSVLVDAAAFLDVYALNLAPCLAQWRMCGYNMLDVALTFGSRLCAPSLAKLMCATPGINNTLPPALFLVDVSQFIPKSLLTDLLKKCSRIGHDVNAADTAHGRTPLHAASAACIVNKDSIRTLLELGADIDAMDFTGNTALAVALRAFCNEGFRFDFGQCISVLQTFLYYNPFPDLTPDALYLAFHIDLANTKLSEALFNAVIQIQSTDPGSSNQTSLLEASPDERILVVSVFAMLLELGFPEKQLPLPQLFHDHSGRNRNADILYHYMQRKHSRRPQSLKASCRLAVRRAFPGQKLHKRFQTMPKELFDYAVRPFFLRPVTIV